MNTLVLTTSAAVAFALFPLNAGAQNTETQDVKVPDTIRRGAIPPESSPGTPEVPPVSHPWTYRLEFSGEHAFSSRVDGPGKAAVSRVGGEFGVSHPFGEGDLLGFSIGGERSFYDINGATQLSPGFNEPFEDTRRISLGVNVFVRQAEQWGWFVGGQATSSMEDDAKFSDSLTFGGRVGVRYWFSKTLSTTAGFAAQTRLEDNALPIPLIGVDWRFADKWRLSTDPGLGLKLAFEPTDGLTLSLDGSYDSREFRLDDKGFAPEGVGIDRRLPIAAGVEWKISSNFTISARGGAYVWQHYKVEDRDGVKLSEADTNPQGFVMVAVKISF